MNGKDISDAIAMQIATFIGVVFLVAVVLGAVAASIAIWIFA